MENYSKNRKMKRILAGILTIIMVFVSIDLSQFVSVQAATEYDTLYLIDNTAEKWVKNDNAKIKAIDNSNGHTAYWMTQKDETTWSVKIPKNAYNITFNRYAEDKTTQWNSWSAGGRDKNNAYYVDGSEYGHWGIKEGDEEYFHAGDIIYLDVSEFAQWEKNDAVMYINFTNASKEENNGNDVLISGADKNMYNPQKVKNMIEKGIYPYIITGEDEGATMLRFWRGNDTTLWNCSVILSYDDYLNGLNCVKVTDWDNVGDIFYYEYNIDEEKDIDNDNVPDYLENYFGTDINKTDTDGDGLSDYVELFVISTDPLLKDTDKNGINDGDEDTDGDGLTNLKEIEINTDLSKMDTDSDNLSDYDEYMVYGTDSLKYDTDGDGVSDGKEVELGTDPLVANTDFNVTVVADEQDNVKVSVETKLSGNQVDTLSVEKYENELFFPSEMPGYIGGAYDFSVEGSINNATIKFEFDNSLLSDKSFDPVIYYFNEDTQLLEEMKTTVEANVATATVTHFSKYILLNRKVFQESFSWQDVWSTGKYSGVEVVLVIDDSGSMTSNDRYNQRLTVARNLVENLPNNSKIGVIKFSDSINMLTSKLTNDKEQAKSYLTSTYYQSYGGTYMYQAINKAFLLFETTNESILKMMIVLSDGETGDTSLHSSVVNTANNNSVKIYTVGLGNCTSYFENYLKPLSNNTAGTFYLASNANQLQNIYNDISDRIDIETDSDGDGIPDYYEDNMIMFNGVKIKLDKNNPDTDGDGLLDGEEVAELNYQYNDDKTKVIVTGRLISNPLEEDSDYDGREDSIDAAPINNHFTGTLETEYATSNVSFDMDYRWFFNNNTLYNEELSITSSLFASAIYHPNKLSIQDSVKIGKTDGKSMKEVMEYFGFKNADTKSLDVIYNDIHLSEVGIGYRPVSYNGEVKNVVAVIIRGTNGTIEEWSSNFDIGDSSTYSTTPDWKTKDNHKGFDVVANRIMKIVQEYVVENRLDNSDIAYWITGHSRGAAIANIIGAYYEKSGKNTYTYTYAAPNTTLSKDTKSYNTIFNVINKDDFVPCLPMEDWGYSRYGRTASVSIAKNYEKEWEKITGIWDYNPDTFGMQDTVDAMAGIISSNTDPREECYKYTCKEHGDGSNNNITITNRGMSKYSREKAIAKIPDNALPYCIITRYDGFLCTGWNFDVCQTPAYFMQILAAKMGGEINPYRFVVELNIAKRYEKAKTGIIKSYLGGVENPHYTESYYILAKNISSSEF